VADAWWLAALAVKFGSKNGRLNGEFLWGYPNSWIVYDGKACKSHENPSKMDDLGVPLF
jgi:hypothetical protein